MHQHVWKDFRRQRRVRDVRSTHCGEYLFCSWSDPPFPGLWDVRFVMLVLGPSVRPSVRTHARARAPS